MTMIKSQKLRFAALDESKRCFLVIHDLQCLCISGGQHHFFQQRLERFCNILGQQLQEDHKQQSSGGENLFVPAVINQFTNEATMTPKPYRQN